MHRLAFVNYLDIFHSFDERMKTRAIFWKLTLEKLHSNPKLFVDDTSLFSTVTNAAL